MAYHPQIPADLAAAYGVSEKDIRFVTQVQNHIFAYERGRRGIHLTADTTDASEHRAGDGRGGVGERPGGTQRPGCGSGARRRWLVVTTCGDRG